MGAQNFEQVWVRRAALPSDEGLGSSIKSDSVGRVVVGNTSEEDGLVQDLIQEADSSDLTSRRLRQRASHPSTRSSSTIAPSAVTESIAPRPSRPTLRHPPLSRSARNKLKEYIISPILEEARFQNLHPFVTALDSKPNKSIRCLRDLEQSLIFQPLVSTLIAQGPAETDVFLKTFAISRHLYRAFGEFTIQLVVDAYQHLSESEQRRAADRPYDNGYFLDLVQQVHRLASHIGSSGRAQQAGTAEEDDEMAYSIDDEVTLEGGLGETGNQAELVRWKNGNGFSLRTGLPYEPTPGIKRQSSGALDEDVARSMARRKKGYIPEYVEMKCSDPSCDKVFTRKCDLAKHEKTHSRPFKCPHKDCKYSEMGLPTEKERDRHINDKHDPNPHFYQCQFCEFKTKRESNCKQHMEKKHSWNYERAKGKDKNMTMKMTPGQTPQTPALDYNSSMQSPMSYTSGAWDESRSRSDSLAGPSITSAQVTPFERPLSAFEGYGQASNHSAIFPRSDAYQQSTFDFNSFVPGNSYISPVSSHRNMTPSTPAYSNITGQSPFSAHMDVAMDYTTPYDNYASLPTPESFLQSVSRHQSISNPSPMYQDVEQSNMYDGGDVFLDDPLISGTTAAPDHDFDLFSGVGDSGRNAFTNPSAANATLFPIMQNDEQFHAAVEKELIDEIYSESESNYDYGAN